MQRFRDPTIDFDDNDDIPEPQIPDFSIRITSPKDGGGVKQGEQFTVRGTTSRDSSVTVTGVAVQLGDSAPFRTATEIGQGWSSWSFRRSVSTAGPMKITARVSVKFPSGGPGGGNGTAGTSVSVVVDGRKPALAITSVIPGNAVSGPGPNFPATILGTASDNHELASVKLSVGGESFPVSGMTNWQSNVSLRSENAHTIVVVATDRAGNETERTTEVIASDTEGPVLDIIEPAEFPSEFEAPVIQVRGSATDGTGINWVKWRLDDGDLRSAFPEGGDWSQWRALIPIPSVGQHTIEFTAEDTAAAKNRTANPITWSFSVSALSDLQGISPTAYLRDLLDFARERVEIAAGSKLNKAALTDAFLQPFDRLDDAAVEDIATRSVSQVRICVETLRQLRNIDSSDDETPYRRAAYFTILRNLGTSYEEIRLVRSADDHVRATLANRLGINVPPRQPASPPDALDQLFLAPEDLANANAEGRFETLFGLVDTRTEVRDPLEDGASPKLLMWRKQYLRGQWRKQDDTTDTAPELIIPRIDPDLIAEPDIRNPISGNLVFDLWHERRQWIADELAKLRARQNDGFDNVVASVLGSIKLLDLAAEHVAGGDIVDTISSAGLSLDSFLVLTRIGRLATAGTLLDSEWEDVFAILVQAAKRTNVYSDWRIEENNLGITLGPDHFKLALTDAGSSIGSEALPRWRADLRERRRWEQTLEARIRQDQALGEIVASTVAVTEEATLPLLRDILIAETAPDESDADFGDWLTRRLQIDMRTSGGQRTTRVLQAIESLQGFLFALRTERLGSLDPLLGPLPFTGWVLTDDQDFDVEWRWLGSYETWRAAILVFGYPQNYLLPSLRLASEQTPAFRDLIKAIRLNVRLSPVEARRLTDAYLEFSEDDEKAPFQALDILINGDESIEGKVNKPSLPLEQHIDVNVFKIEVGISEEETRELKRSIKILFQEGEFDPIRPPSYVAEICYFVPMLMGLHLQRSGHYLAALDYFQLVYAYNRPLEERKIYHGLTAEEGFQKEFRRPVEWILSGLNPHQIAVDLSPRANAYSRFTVMSIVRCFLEFADTEFTRATKESIPRARALYIAALDFLGDIEEPEASEDDSSSFPPNPVPKALRLHASTNLRKLRDGRNIAGLERETAPEPLASTAVPVIGADGQIVLPTDIVRHPTPYRFAVLIARAKELVGIAQQIEAAYLSALEKRDAEAYSLLQARQHVQLAEQTLDLQALRADEAHKNISLSELQRDRARTQYETYISRIEDGLSEKEKASLALMGTSAGLSVVASQFHGLHAAKESVNAALSFGLSGSPEASTAAFFSSLASAASTTAGLLGTWASFERREQEWELQKSLSQKDLEITSQQIKIARGQHSIAVAERDIADTQMNQANAVVNFLATEKFTNQELYEWMIDVLRGVYAYFLQQATATAALAQSQLAFERQETPPALIQADYWQPPSDEGGPPTEGDATSDRRGITGSVRLLQDIYRLDQHAFETRKRMLQLSQMFSLARLVPYEFQLFRETGILPFATPMELFDRGFPGHYLRLVKRVRLSIVALVPPSQGVRATLTASGLSRVDIAGSIFSDAFQTIIIRRSPEQISFTSPINATGLLDLEPEGELLLPFESMGVDGTWELALPKAANPFDYTTIADVLMTVEYTALASTSYREQVIRRLDPRVSADRAFSFRNEFPDAFYHLNNPAGDGAPIIARFETERDDYPPNIDKLVIEHVSIYFVRGENDRQANSGDDLLPIDITNFLFEPKLSDEAFGGPAVSGSDGIISTRREENASGEPIGGNAANWVGMIHQHPIGTWALEFSGEMRSRLEDGEIDDIIFAITYSGEQPSWPS